MNFQTKRKTRSDSRRRKSHKKVSETARAFLLNIILERRKTCVMLPSMKVFRGEKTLSAQQLNLLFCTVAKPWKFHSLTARFVIGKSLSNPNFPARLQNLTLFLSGRKPFCCCLHTHNDSWNLCLPMLRKSIRTRSLFHNSIYWCSQMCDRGDEKFRGGEEWSVWSGPFP